MWRRLGIILLLAAFVGGYYVRGLPGSPDVFRWVSGVYDRVDKATNDIAVKAQQDDTSLVNAAASYVVSGDACAVEGRD